MLNQWMKPRSQDVGGAFLGETSRGSQIAFIVGHGIRSERYLRDKYFHWSSFWVWLPKGLRRLEGFRANIAAFDLDVIAVSFREAISLKQNKSGRSISHESERFSKRRLGLLPS